MRTLLPSRFLATFAFPLIWWVAILVFSGNLGSSAHTLGLLKTVFSGIFALDLATLEFINGYLRKLGHMLAYGFLYFLWFRALNLETGGRRQLSLALAVAIALLTACLDEGHQAMFASRTGSVADVALDMTGVALWALIFPGFLKPRAAPR